MAGTNRRRSIVFAVATGTGVLALLLILGWQISQFIADKPAGGDDDSAEDTRHAVRSSTPDSNASGEKRLIRGMTTPHIVDKRSESRDAPLGDPFHDEPASTTGARDTNAGNPTANSPKTPSVPSPRIERENPFADRGSAAPMIRDGGGRKPSPFDESSADKKSQREPDNSSPFVKTVQPRITDSRPAAGAVPAATAKDGVSLGLEVVRTAVTPAPRPEARFLVTGTSPQPPLKDDSPSKIIRDGWLAAGEKRKASRILRTDHGTTAKPGIPLTSSATSRWSVAGPKLAVQIVLPRQITAGQRVPVRLRIANVGPAAAERVTLHVDLPARMTYHLGRKLTYDVGHLPAGATHIARLTPVAARSGEADISAVVFCDTHRAGGIAKRTIQQARR